MAVWTNTAGSRYEHAGGNQWDSGGLLCTNSQEDSAEDACRWLEGSTTGKQSEDSAVDAYDEMVGGTL